MREVLTDSELHKEKFLNIFLVYKPSCMIDAIDITIKLNKVGILYDFEKEFLEAWNEFKKAGED